MLITLILQHFLEESLLTLGDLLTVEITTSLATWRVDPDCVLQIMQANTGFTCSPELAGLLWLDN